MSINTQRGKNLEASLRRRLKTHEDKRPSLITEERGNTKTVFILEVLVVNKTTCRRRLSLLTERRKLKTVGINRTMIKL